MKIIIGSTIIIAALGLGGGLGISLSAAEEHSTSDATQLTPKFPKSDKCSTSSPCRDVIGEIVRIEESYWIKMPNGHETHMRVSPETKIESRLKVGDSVAAQLTSSGDADAIMKFDQKPQAKELPAPKGTLKEMR